MTVAFFSLLFFLAASALLILAARSDWRGLVIPNEYSLALIGVFIIGALFPAAFFPGVTFFSGLVAGAVVFVATILMYAARAMGGGDTKLASAAALLLGTQFMGLFLVVMAVTGGLLAIYAILTRRHGDRLLPATPDPGTWLARLKAGENKLPYGVAIAVGAITALFVKWVVPLLAAAPLN